MKKIIPYGRQFIDKNDIKSVISVLESDNLTQGKEIDRFEKMLAKKCDSKYAVVVNSGTAALHTAYFALGLTGGDEFITSPLTFAATANAGLYLDAKPVFVDVLSNGNIDEIKIEEKINKKTKLIVAVHYGGNPANLDEIRKIAKRHNLFVVEDACHALGATYMGTKIGSSSFSDLTVLSFHPVKHITTGEGGAVLTNNKFFYEKMLMFRTHGITKNNFIKKTRDMGDWYYEMQCMGFNYRMTDIHAALGISQLKKLDGFVKRRREVACIYDNLFVDNPFFNFPVLEKNKESSFHLYPILLKDKYKNRKKEIFRGLRQKGLGVQVHYIPVYNHPYYKNLGYKEKCCPVSENFYAREISLPIYFSLTNKDVNIVAKIIFSVFKNI